MGIFDKVKKEVKVEVSDDDVNGSGYALPFTKVGDEHSGSDYYAACYGPDTYKLYVGPYANLAARSGGVIATRGPSPFNGGGLAGIALSSAYGTKEYTVDANTITAVINGASLPHLGLSRMTQQQKDKLTELKTEIENWKKQQRLVAFKKLPSHIRQEIVDECLIKKLVSEVENIDITKAPDYTEFKKLKDLEDGYISNMYGTLSGAHTTSMQYAGLMTAGTYQTYKYGRILDMFNHDELMKAHAEASLEDELSN